MQLSVLLLLPFSILFCSNSFQTQVFNTKAQRQNYRKYIHAADEYLFPSPPKYLFNLLDTGSKVYRLKLGDKYVYNQISLNEMFEKSSFIRAAIQKFDPKLAVKSLPGQQFAHVLRAITERAEKVYQMPKSEDKNIFTQLNIGLNMIVPMAKSIKQTMLKDSMVIESLSTLIKSILLTNEDGEVLEMASGIIEDLIDLLVRYERERLNEHLVSIVACLYTTKDDNIDMEQSAFEPFHVHLRRMIERLDQQKGHKLYKLFLAIVLKNYDRMFIKCVYPNRYSVQNILLSSVKFINERMPISLTKYKPN